MKIIIAGAGDMGFHLARLLASESQDIILIDTNQQVLDYAQSHLDVFVLKGNITSIKTLQEAEVHRADLLVAVTSSEENNLIGAILGKKMGAKMTLARVDHEEYTLPEHVGTFEQLGIDALISPRKLAAKEISRLINRAALTDVFEFEQGKLFLIGITLDSNSPIINLSVLETAHLNPDLVFQPIAVLREQKTIIPRSNTVFQVNDHVYFITQKKYIDTILQVTGKEPISVKRVMILGGGITGRLTASMLEDKYQVILVENNQEKCYNLAERLPKTLVIYGDGRDVQLLEEEGLEGMDAFIAVTPNSETNIITSLIAKKHGVKRTIALVENIEYIHLSQNIGVDTLINRKLIAANNIFRYIRRGQIEDITSLHGVDAEVIEFVVKKNSAVTKKEIKNLSFPENALIGGVIRGNESHIPRGDFRIAEGDKVVVFAMPNAISTIERLFN
ncbi:MAG: Trk system potassium transporter TrkA [Chitinophagales bacterium]